MLLKAMFAVMALPGAVDKKATPLCLPPMAEIVWILGEQALMVSSFVIP